MGPMDRRSELTAREAASTVEAPVFLVGSERSGTTMLRLMLDHQAASVQILAFPMDLEIDVAFKVVGQESEPDLEGDQPAGERQ